jgi:hypothetical protein
MALHFMAKSRRELDNLGARKRELGLAGGEVFVPQSYKLGQEARLD